MKFAAAVISAFLLQAVSAETRLRKGDFVSANNSLAKTIVMIGEFVDCLSDRCVLISTIVVSL